MGERIVSVRLSRIGKIDVDKIVLPPGRHIRHNACRQITMRIDERAAASGPDVLIEKGLDKGRFSRSGLTNHMHVGKPVSLLNAEHCVLCSGVGYAKVQNIL